jgi:hypothetical protein
MPHQCTNCGRTFPDGSKEMLSGCPECGGNKFQFKPAGTITIDDDGNVTGESGSRSRGGAGADEDRHGVDGANADSSGSGDAEAASSGAEAASSDARATSSGAEAASSRERPSKEWVGLDRDDDPSAAATGDDDIIEADETPLDTEDSAQADARSATATPDEVADAAAMPPDADSRVIEPQTDERPDISELREELNDQFESIKIVSPGQYELNLMELYDRDEYIISLQEDGRYVIEVPDAWRDDDA